ncbi:hypothetical protein CTEN210_13413 [Chaetoceros tenuissimus]|uniref:HSF-type DNA-binding domain-containing protein n=1 Tax=Chaetoceros tenuissimus TaxID=426638 RepID=A0AAD3D318_9STRA|nr:hypothetical protein CTEN210_13413 [Chaetoceros tenuissimus]
MNPVTTIHTSPLTPSTDTGEHRQQQRSKRGGCKYPFPQRLFDLLEYIDVRKPELSRIISWCPNGKAFQVHDRKAFEQQIQPKMFNQSKYGSFNRQLNLWGFERIPHQRAGACYFHPLFQSHDRNLCCTMYRSKGPGTTTSVSSKRSTTAVSEGRHGSLVSSGSICFTTTRPRSNQQTSMLLNESTTTPWSSLESRLRRTEQLLDQQQQQGHGQDTTSSNGEDSSSTSSDDDREFHDLITYLSANDDNILKYLLES